MRGVRFLLFVVAMPVLVNGCNLMRTAYVRPDAPVPPTYAHADEAAKAKLDHWWESFGDVNLSALVVQALQANNDLALAAINVRAAEIQTHLAVVNPLITAGYTYDYSRPLTAESSPTRFHSLTASVSYEVDLWGQLGALKDVARWEARASLEDRRSAALALIGTTVNLYYQIAALNQRIALGEQSVAYAQKTLDLVYVLAAAGSVTKLEVAQAEESLKSQKAVQTGLIEQRIETRNALHVALNGIAWPDSRELLAVPDAPPPPVAPDLPASLLDRRPDLRAAELRLRETLAGTDAVRLSFYPNLSLTGSLGTASTGLSELVSNPLGSLAAAVSVPFIQIDQAHFSTALARTQYEKAVVSVRKTLLQALIDVDNALSARSQFTDEGIELKQSLDAARIVEHLNEVRYRAGSVALQLWLASQETRRQSEIALVTNQLDRMQNYVTLCLALGGGADSL
jgi:NodT family efflux transporter outer membrane factor (OMF) lipoprotein